MRAWEELKGGSRLIGVGGQRCCAVCIVRFDFRGQKALLHACLSVQTRWGGTLKRVIP